MFAGHLWRTASIVAAHWISETIRLNPDFQWTNSRIVEPELEQIRGKNSSQRRCVHCDVQSQSCVAAAVLELQGNRYSDRERRRKQREFL